MRTVGPSDGLRKQARYRTAPRPVVMRQQLRRYSPPRQAECGPAHHYREHRLVIRVKVAPLQRLSALPSTGGRDVGQRKVHPDRQRKKRTHVRGDFGLRQGLQQLSALIRTVTQWA